MYHDEFAKKPERSESTDQNPLPTLAMAVGGGLWLSLMISLNQPILTLLFFLGGLLPLLASCLNIAWYRCSRFVTGPTSQARSWPRPNLTLPQLTTTPATSPNGPYRRYFRTESIEARHEAPRRIGDRTR